GIGRHRRSLPSPAARPAGEPAGPPDGTEPPVRQSPVRQHTRRRRSRMAQRAKDWPGWIMFAAVILTIIGPFNVLQGLAALLQRQVIYLSTGRLVVVDLTTWGLLALVSGALLVAVGLGLLSRNGLARAVAVALVALHAFVQLTALAAFPIWSLLMIALDVVVLFALTVTWPGSPPGWNAGWPPRRTA